MGKMSFSSIVELEKKKREELLCVERKALGGEGRGGEGGSRGEVEAAVGPAGAHGAAAPHPRHAHTASHGPSVREVRTVRPLQTETSLLSLNSKIDLPSLQKFHKNLC
jgi:hypothetical protein